MPRLRGPRLGRPISVGVPPQGDRRTLCDSTQRRTEGRETRAGGTLAASRAIARRRQMETIPVAADPDGQSPDPTVGTE